MKRISHQYGLSIFLLIGSFTVNAQQGFVTSGGDASSTNGKVSFSIGQIDYINITSAAGSFTSGVQQSFEIFVVSGIDEKQINLIQGSQIIAKAFPNPTQESITLLIDGNKLTNLSYQVYDLQWRLIKTDKAHTGETFIDLSNENGATYFLRVLSEDKEIKLFKIIKNQ